jgi:hypothetical protein
VEELSAVLIVAGWVLPVVGNLQPVAVALVFGSEAVALDLLSLLDGQAA